MRSLGPIIALGAFVLLGPFAAPAFGTAPSWDPNGSGGSGLGGSGSWDNFSSQWYASGGFDQSWSPGDAAFTTTPGTVTITDPSVTVNNLYFSVSGYQITGNTLMLSGGSVQILPKNASETINAPIMASAPGVGLTLLPTGTGVLTINGPASYTGPTNVSSGTLLFNGPDSTSSISVGNGNKTVGALGGVLSTTAIVSVASTTLSTKDSIIAGYAGSGSMTVGGLSFAGPANIYISNVSQYAASSSAAIVVTGSNALAVTTANSIPLILTGPAPSGSGSVELLQYSGSIAGNVSGGNSTAFTLTNQLTGAGARAVFSLTNPPGYIDLSYKVDYPVWTGALDGKWVTSAGTAATSPADWESAISGAPTTFLQGDTVVFSDSATNTAVNISSAAVSPASVLFIGNTSSYTLTGAYGIAGGGGLTVNGSGSVTIATSNGYTGGTVLNSGRLNVNNANALGSGTLSINGGTLDNTSGAAVTLAKNNPLAINGSFVYGGSGALNLGTGNVALSNSATVYLNTAMPLTIGGAMADNGTGLTINGQGFLAPHRQQQLHRPDERQRGHAASRQRRQRGLYRQ